MGLHVPHHKKMQAAFLIHEGLIFNLLSQSSWFVFGERKGGNRKINSFFSKEKDFKKNRKKKKPPGSCCLCPKGSQKYL